MDYPYIPKVPYRVLTGLDLKPVKRAPETP